MIYSSGSIFEQCPSVPKLDDLHVCTKDVSDSHSTSSLVLHVLARTAHSLHRVIKAVPWLDIYSGSLLLLRICLSQASIIKHLSLLLGC